MSPIHRSQSLSLEDPQDLLGRHSAAPTDVAFEALPAESQARAQFGVGGTTTVLIGCTLAPAG